jgi:hypothetical protein
MADLVFVSIIVAFFALCVIYLKWCDHIIGPDESFSEQDDRSPYVATDRATVEEPAAAVEVTA